MRLGILALGAILLGAPFAGAQGTSELEILDAYLAEHDAGGSWEHCQRHGGGDLVVEQPDVPLPAPVTYTNELLRHHALWHKERLSLVEGSTASPDDEDRYGDDFYGYHRAMILDYDAWRATHGFEPVPPWEPTTPIPAAFAPSADPGCLRRNTDDPGIEKPAWATLQGGDEKDPLFNEYRALCEFPDLNRLGKAIDFDGAQSYHAQVHDAVNGDMAFPPGAPRDPVFWAWHKFLDDTVFRAWERECETSGSAPGDVTGQAQGAAVEPGRGVPAPPAWLALAGAALVAASLRRRSA